jgi:hypothetical protein
VPLLEPLIPSARPLRTKGVGLVCVCDDKIEEKEGFRLIYHMYRDVCGCVGVCV